MAMVNLFGPLGSARRRHVVGNTLWLFLERLTRFGLSFLIGVLVARYLGPRDFGVLNTAATLLGFSVAVARLGMDRTLVRELVIAAGRDGSLLATAMIVKALASIGIFLVGAVVAVALFDQSEHVVPVLIVVAAVLFQPSDVMDAWFEARVAAKYLVVARLAAFTIVAAIKIFLLISHASLTAFAWAMTVEVALSAVLVARMFAAKRGFPRPWTFSSDHARHLFRESWPLLISAVATIAYMQIDVLMLSVMRSTADAGIYTVASRLSEVWYFIPVAVATSVLPWVTEARQSAPETYQRLLRFIFNALAATGLIIALVLSLVAPWLMPWLFGAAYEESAAVLRVHVWATPFMFLGNAQSLWIVSERLPVISMQRAILGAVTNILLNLWLIPRYGPLGAAYATVVSYAAAGVFANLFSARTRDVFRMQMVALLQLGWSRR